MVNHRRHILTSAVLVLISTFVMYFIIRALFPIVPGLVAEAAPIDALFTGHWWVIAFLFSLVTVILVYCIVVFRREEGDETDGEYMHGNTALEVTWTVAPLALVVVFAFWGSNLLLELTSDSNYPDPYIVDVEGFQWGWRFTYPDPADAAQGQSIDSPRNTGQTTSSLYLPVNENVILRMDSVDVLHSFWVPEFRVKQDLVPGETKYLRFRPTVLSSEYSEQLKVRCAEICGFRHAYMLSDVFVIESKEAVAEQLVALSKLPDNPVERGAIWYEEFGCQTCHSLDGTQEGYSGPTWLGLYERDEVLDNGQVVVADDDYIRESIYLPRAKIVEGYPANQMPVDFEQQFAEREAEVLIDPGLDVDIVNDLIEFIKTLE